MFQNFQIESLKRALANKEAFNKTSEKPRTTTERTPQRLRRLSIENCSTVKTEKAMNLEDRKGFKTPSLPTRSRRLSLEGPMSVKKNNLQMSHDIGKFQPSEAVPVQKFGQLQGAEAVIKPLGHFSNENSTLEVFCPEAPQSPTITTYQKRALETDSRTQAPSVQLPTTPEPRLRTPLSPPSATYQKRVLETDSRTQVPPRQPPTTPETQTKAPRSPKTATYQKQGLKANNRTRIPALQLPTTPEPPTRSRNEVQIVMQSKVTLSTDYLTPNLTSSTSKGSQIRRSLRTTIGKLINGSEKR